MANCKICGSQELTVCAHTASCRDCGVLLFFPYPTNINTVAGSGKSWSDQDDVRWWYAESSARNHANFTNMAAFALEGRDRGTAFDVLDYGGGGGQFALVCKSLFPWARVHIVDVADDALLDEWRPLNRQIRFADFERDGTKFDAIFLNDVFEHVNDPRAVLQLLSSKLKDRDSVIFIDTPKQFWIYRASKLVSLALHTKILKGTVSTDHQQIWSRKAFDLITRNAQLHVAKYLETSEFTMSAAFYLRNMGIKNAAMIGIGNAFYRCAKLLAKNKIMAVLKHY